jgi:hypothetical protein
MATISDPEKIAFSDKAHKLAEQTSGSIEVVLVDLQPEGQLRVDGATVPNRFRDEVLAAATRHPGIAMGIVLRDNGQLEILPDPLPIPEPPSS